MGISSNSIHLATLSAVSSLIKDQNLLRANSLMIGVESSATLLAPLISGIIILEYGTSLIIWLDIVLFVSGLFFLTFIDEFNDCSQKQIQFDYLFFHFSKNLKDGLYYINKEKSLITLLTIIAMINFIFSLSFAFFIPMILSYSENNAGLLGLINTIGGSGQILGVIVSAYLLKPIHKVNGILKPIFILGLLGPCVIGLKASPIFWSVGYAITLGLLAIINSINQTFWQSLSPPHLQGIIFGIRRMVTSLAGPFGLLLATPTLHLFSNFNLFENQYQLLFCLAGLLISFLSLVAFLIIPDKTIDFELTS